MLSFIRLAVTMVALPSDITLTKTKVATRDKDTAVTSLTMIIVGKMENGFWDFG